jgi:two-component system, NarL family, response regulator NreC
MRTFRWGSNDRVDMPTNRILIADDHMLVRQALRNILRARADWDVVAEAGDGREAVRLAVEQRPDVAIIDVAMPVLNGIDAAEQIRRLVPATSVLMLSMHADEAYVTRSIAAGARGYLLKETAEADLLIAVDAVAGGNTFFSAPIERMRPGSVADEPSGRSLAEWFDALSTGNAR